MATEVNRRDFLNALALLHCPVVTCMEEQRVGVTCVEPAHLILPNAAGHLREFCPKEYRSHFIVLAIGDGEEVLDGFPDFVEEAEFLPEFLTDLTHHRLFWRLSREGASARQPVAVCGSYCRNGSHAVSDNCIGS
jgi:hypothetical protein